MADLPSGFTQFVPGFDFLQSLVKNAGAALPSMGQWVVPTLDPAELERRIEELRTVQFWLDQNSRMLATTIQALEVQRMTLSALKGMNVSVSELQQALRARAPEPPSAPQPASAEPARPTAASAPEAPAAAGGESPAGAATPPAGAVDAMQWWSALTQQFTQIASQAMQGAVPPAANPPAGKPRAGKASPSASAKAPASPPAKAKGEPPTARRSPRAAKP